jgi:hypothetical protein
MIKFMELWWFGCNMCDLFSQQDIPSIRVQILNDLVFCKHNFADINVVKNYGGLVSFCFCLIVFWCLSTVY